MVDVSASLTTSARWWWMEVGRYSPQSFTAGTLAYCWGDPSDYPVVLNDGVGGDCNDSSTIANRDLSEGPGDLLGWYYEDPASCDTCLDGIDNNCDGSTDCADPACAPCFVGQGAGCGGGVEAPCAEMGGCGTTRAPLTNARQRTLVGTLLALMIVAVRRRSFR